MSLEYRGYATPGGYRVTPKNMYFYGFGGSKNYLVLQFWSDCADFWLSQQRANTKILSSHFFAISILNQNYDVINDVISGFEKVVVEPQCGSTLRLVA